MTERRARGTSPAGRGDRRTPRATRPRPSADPHSRAAAAKRTVRSRSTKQEPQRERSERTILGLSTGKAVILAMVVCALALTLAVPMRTFFSQRAEAAQLEQERRAIETELDVLRDRRSEQQDPAYIRSEARQRLRLVMPGETPYIVQVPGIEEPAPADPTEKPREPDPWYTDLWHSVAAPREAPTAHTAPRQPEGLR